MKLYKVSNLIFANITDNNKICLSKEQFKNIINKQPLFSFLWGGRYIDRCSVFLIIIHISSTSYIKKRSKSAAILSS